MNDEELDDLFRQAAGQHAQQPFQEDDAARKALVWSKLRRQLDASKTSRHTYLLVLLLIGTGLIGLLLYRPAGHQQEMPPATEQTAGPATSPADVPPESVLADPAGRVSNSGKDGKAAQDAKKTAAPAYTAAPERKDPVGPPFTDTRKPNINLQPDQGHPRASPLSFPKKRLQSLPFISIKKPVKVPAYISPGRLQAPPAIRQNTDDTAGAGSFAGQYIKDRQAVKEKPAARHGYWNLGLTLGPDWHSVAGGAWHIGTNGGLTLTYHINRKWAAGTGVLADKMIYDAQPGDYHPSNNNWQNYDVKYIHGNCLVVDVPLNAAYTLWENTNHRIFAEGGLSSFWMHSEAYTYHYKTTSGDWGQWSRKMHDKNYHIFSVINISPGYESRWKDLSLDIAPYVKIPLHGIGYGRVKLYSAGIHFSLRYNLK